MATLKDHQQAMVDLLASGSGIPASASRLAHAMHDVLSAVMQQVTEDAMQQSRDFAARIANDATTPGLNDKALSKRERALKTDSPAKWPTPAEQRVKELENTIRQLKANNAKLKQERALLDSSTRQMMDKWFAVEAVLVRATTAENKTEEFNWLSNARDIALGYIPAPEPEQAGCRKPDTQECDHPEGRVDTNIGFCSKCGGYL